MKDIKSFLIVFLMCACMYAGKFENPNGSPGLLTIGYDVEGNSPYATLPIFNFLSFKFQSGRDGYLVNNLQPSYYGNEFVTWGGIDCTGGCDYTGQGPSGDELLLRNNDYVDLSKHTFILEFHIPLWSKKN